MSSGLRARLPWRARAQYLLSATYFLSGWTLLLYMSLPVVRLLFGVQPLARITADQFLIHFAPYYCGALATVALAGSGTYTFGAFALATSNFWIHIYATLGALARRGKRFTTRSALVPLSLPASQAAVTFTRLKLSVRLGSRARGTAKKVGGSLFFANVAGTTDALVRPTPQGADASFVLRGRKSPRRTKAPTGQRRDCGRCCSTRTKTSSRKRCRRSGP